MNIKKAITGMLSVAGLTVLAASASFAQSFGYTTNFTPNPITSSALGNFITVFNGASPLVTAPTQINLSNFVEVSNTPPPSMVTFSQPFTVALTVTPVGGSAMTKDFTGTMTGNYNTNQTFSQVSIDAPGSLTFNFGSLGTYTFNQLAFVAPGPSTSTTRGSLGATVLYTPVGAVPEPGTVASFMLGGLGLLGLVVRARKVSRTGGLSA